MSGAAGARRYTADVDQPVSPGPLALAVAGACPQCKSRTLFDGWVQFAKSCRVCGLDIDSYNVGDGPAAFLILIVGAALTAAAIAVELAFEPAFWVHVIWIPLGASLTIFGLRFGKSLLLMQEYRHRAREGRRTH